MRKQRDGQGRFIKKANNLFNVGDVVCSSGKHFGYLGIVRISDMRFTEDRGWVCAIEYLDWQGARGGTSLWWAEDEFAQLSSVSDILLAERIKRRLKIQELEKLLITAKTELEQIEYSH